jgi:hypothetical protein
MYETILLKCRCARFHFATGNDLDLGEVLRDAIDDGWRRIDEEPIKAVESDGVTEIVLAGTCARCDQRQPSLLDRVSHFLSGSPSRAGRG